MRAWIGPLVLASLGGLAAYFTTFVAAPDVLMRLALGKITSAPGVTWNRFNHSPPTTAARQLVVRPSPDLLYSACPYDLSGGPVEVRAVPVPDHYWSISVFDAHTNAVFVRNDDQQAGRPLRFVLALPGQPVPADMRAVRVDAARGVVLQRVLLTSPGEAATVDPLRRQARCFAIAQIGSTGG